MSGQVFVLPVMDTIYGAWGKVYGAKKTFWAAIGILVVIMFGIGLLEGITEKAWAISGLLQTIGNVLGYFLQLGLMYMGIARAKDKPIEYKMLFKAFDLELILRIIGLYIFETLIFMVPVIVGAIGVILFTTTNFLAQSFGVLLMITSVIATLVVAVKLSLAMAYVLDADSAPLVAIKQSLAATTNNVLPLFAIFILQLIIIGLGMVPLLLGLIWALPFAWICYGLAYKQLSANN